MDATGITGTIIAKYINLGIAPSNALATVSIIPAYIPSMKIAPRPRAMPNNANNAKIKLSEFANNDMYRPLSGLYSLLKK